MVLAQATEHRRVKERDFLPLPLMTPEVPQPPELGEFPGSVTFSTLAMAEGTWGVCWEGLLRVSRQLCGLKTWTGGCWGK